MRSLRLTAALGAGFLILACSGGTTDEAATDEPGLLADQDRDDDGFAHANDCNDDNAAINPDASEVCDPAVVDENCDGFVDSADPTAGGAVTAWHDADADGYGDPENPASVCELSDGFVGNDSDCDDTDPAINRGAEERCDPQDVDEDCNGLAEDADPNVYAESYTSWYPDRDGDGFGALSEGDLACDAPPSFSDESSDCDDVDSTIHVDALDVWCDGVDSDGSGGSDYDWDGDRFDADATTYPGAYETGARDSNCDGVARATPQAVADYDPRTSTLDLCSPVYLDGTASRDPGGSALTYAWELVNSPTTSGTSTDSLVEADDVEPTFIPDVAGDYSFELVVTNTSSVASVADSLSLTIADRATNIAPVANAGADDTTAHDATCSTGSYTAATCDDCTAVTYTLDASRSTDGDGDSLTYTWAISVGSGTVSSASGDTTTLSVPGGAGTYGSTLSTSVTVELTATDCFGDTDTVTLTATCTDV